VSGTDDAAGGISAKVLRRVLWAFLVFFGSICLFVALLYGHYESRVYQAAISTSATITGCATGRSGVSCRGTWDIEGQQYHGSINGVGSWLPPGSLVGVRADRYRAYASPPVPYQPAIVVSVVLAVAAVALTAWGWLRGRPGGRP
jgi:hypothetical protein